MKLTALPQFSRNAMRFREIVTVLTKYGLADWFEAHDPDFIRGLLKSHDGTRLTSLTREQRIRSALTELGTTFIKLGQVLSTRPDLVGHDLAEELSNLQSDAPRDDPEAVREIVIAELGQPIEALFDEFEDVAFASASIAQVHRARLHDGQDVVVKVQHVGIATTVARDLDILAALANFAEQHNANARLYQPSGAIREFKRTILRELDFNRERQNLEMFTRQFEDNPQVHFPIPYAAVSSRRVLTMERLDGCSIGNSKRLEEEGVDTKQLAINGAHIYLDMIFRNGVYHADPHPGNILVLKDSVIGIIDCGMVGRLSDREGFETALLAVAQGDAETLCDQVLRMSKYPDDLDRQAMRGDLSELLADYAGQTASDLNLSGALSGVINIIRDYHILLPSDASMLLRVLIMLEGTSKNLHRDFNLAELLIPYQKQMIQNRLSPKALYERLQRSWRDWSRLIDILPRNLVDVMERVQQGRFEVRLSHSHLDLTVNRLVYGIVIAALFTGSSLMWSAKAQPTVWDVSILGAFGCFVGLILGAHLLRAIAKEGGLRERRK
jgi:ubiquinone biosynthesis protein